MDLGGIRWSEVELSGSESSEEKQNSVELEPEAEERGGVWLRIALVQVSV